jgi:hypothetical protein
MRRQVVVTDTLALVYAGCGGSSAPEPKHNPAPQALDANRRVPANAPAAKSARFGAPGLLLDPVTAGEPETPVVIRSVRVVETIAE